MIAANEYGAVPGSGDSPILVSKSRFNQHTRQESLALAPHGDVQVILDIEHLDWDFSVQAGTFGPLYQSTFN